MLPVAVLDAVVSLGAAGKRPSAAAAHRATGRWSMPPSRDHNRSPRASGHRGPHVCYAWSGPFDGHVRPPPIDNGYTICYGLCRECQGEAADWPGVEDFRGRTIVSLVAEGRSIGLLMVNTRQPRQFDEDEVGFLCLMANQPAMAIEKARLHQEEIKRQRLEEEMAVGRKIQLGLLPEECPGAPGWEFTALYQPAKSLSPTLWAGDLILGFQGGV